MIRRTFIKALCASPLGFLIPKPKKGYWDVKPRRRCYIKSTCGGGSTMLLPCPISIAFVDQANCVIAMTLEHACAIPIKHPVLYIHEDGVGEYRPDESLIRVWRCEFVFVCKGFGYRYSWVQFPAWQLINPQAVDSLVSKILERFPEILDGRDG